MTHASARQPTDWIVPIGIAAIACLLVMFAVAVATGVSQEQFELLYAAPKYAADLRDHALMTRLVFAVDAAFLVLYAAFFLLFARRVATDATRTLLAIAVGAILLTALCDMIEDHHILAMLSSSEAGAPPSAGELTFQQTLSQVKFNVSYLGLFLFGLAVPRGRTVNTALILLLTVGTLVQGAWLYVAPPGAQALGSMGRWAGFIVGFVLAIAVVRNPDEARAEAGTGAPA